MNFFLPMNDFDFYNLKIEVDLNFSLILSDLILLSVKNAIKILFILLSYKFN